MEDFLLEFGDLLLAQAVRLCDDRHDADLVRELLHDLDVQGLEAVTVRVNEVEAAVDPVVDDVLAIQAALIPEVSLIERKNAE